MGGRGKNAGLSDDRREQSVYRANAFRGHRRGWREGGGKKSTEQKKHDGWSRWIARSMFYLRRQGGGWGRGEEGFSRSKFSWFVEDAMFPTTLSIDFDRFSFRSYRRELSNL